MRLGEPYRSQESQDVNLPDATALQVGDGGPLFLLVFGRHFGDGSTTSLLLIVVRPRDADQKYLQTAAFSDPWSQKRARRRWLESAVERLRGALRLVSCAGCCCRKRLCQVEEATLEIRPHLVFILACLHFVPGIHASIVREILIFELFNDTTWHTSIFAVAPSAYLSSTAITTVQTR